MAEYWLSILILLCGIVAAILAYKLYRYLLARADITASQLDDIIVLSFGKPLIVAILALTVYFSITYLDVPPEFAWVQSSRYLFVFYIFLAGWVVSVFTQSFIELYGRWLSSRTETEIDDKIIGFLEITARYIVWFIAFLLALSYLEIDITPLVAGAGIIGLAVALAAQDILSNFFGGALIVIDKPFKVNDRIRVEEHLGDVVSIGPRSTRIKTLDYQILTIPNSKIASSIIINYAMPDVKLKVKIPVSVAYGSDIARVKEILAGIAKESAEEVDYILRDPAPSVYFLEFGASSLDFMMVVWASAFNMSWEVKDHINSRIDESFREEGIEIPFPQMDVHVRE
ncbi:MAG: mechanosensitive ion channel family protein [Methanomicrobiaceae archaeon]|nr:mechanosensitive ion channel family protein [Methanomicrobiaceae archaeon]